MRREFSTTIEAIGRRDEKLIFLTGDLGFMALENVAQALGHRFINAGVSEQNMISMAAGLASQGLKPICYSIAPFAIFRPAEQLRIDVGLHNMNVKIVGNGGGYGYGIMGATHHAIEDIGVVSSFQNFVCYIPCCIEDVAGAVHAMIDHTGPAYLRLGTGRFPSGVVLPDFADIRQVLRGGKITMICLGPVTINALMALEMLNMKSEADLFVAGKMPLERLSEEFLQSIRTTGKLIILEEHVSRGGLGEHLALHLMMENVSCKVIHRFAKGYPNGLYGSQQYHQALCGLDAESIKDAVETILKID